jgi:D-glycero-D-manno-heptose 1,7-bisphosphate phosphatase
MPNRAVFIDKDGTLIEDVPYNVNPKRIRLMPGAAQALPILHTVGYRLIVISNQSGVARGYFPEEALAGVEVRLRELLAQAGAPLTGFYYCPHHPDGMVPAYSINCSCRKPAPGLLIHAANEHGINLEQSWFVGDILDDVEAGRRAGCKTILLNNGHETEWQLSAERRPHYLAINFLEVVSIIETVDGITSIGGVDLSQSKGLSKDKFYVED